jgi:hypothetical protein
MVNYLIDALHLSYGGNAPSGSIKGGHFLGYMSDYLPPKDSAPWNESVEVWLAI